MNKLFLIITLLFVQYRVFCQENKNLYYNEGKIQIVTSEKDRIVDVKPMGYNVGITYNSYFKYYIISYINENERIVMFKLEYMKMRGGLSKIMRRTDSQDNYYVVDEKLASKGLFLFRPDDNETDINIIIDGLKPCAEPK